MARFGSSGAFDWFLGLGVVCPLSRNAAGAGAGAPSPDYVSRQDDLHRRGGVLRFSGRAQGGLRCYHKRHVAPVARSLDSLDVRPAPGIESVGNIPPPIWSPDSRFIAFNESSSAAS